VGVSSPAARAREGLLRSVGRDALVYSVGPALVAVAGLALVPALTRMFPPAEYGAVDTVLVLVTSLGAVAVLGVDAAAGRWFFDTEDEDERRRTLAAAFAFLGVSGVVVAALLAIFAAPIARYGLLDPTLTSAVMIAALGLPAAAVEGLLRHVLRWRRRRGAFLAAYLALTFGRVVLTVALAHAFGAPGVVGGWVASMVLSASVAFAVGREGLGLRWDGARVRAYLAYGAPFAASQLAVPLAMILERFILLRWRGAADVGLYGAGLRIAGAYTLASEGFRLAWGPIASARWLEPGFGRSFGRLVSAFVVVAAGGALVAELLGPFVFRVVAPSSYAGAGAVVGLFVLGGAMQDLLALTSVGVFFGKKTGVLLLGAATTVVLGVALDLALVPRLGFRGAALASVVARLAAALLVGALSQRHLRVEVQRGPCLVAAGLAVATVIAALVL
jgi:O-antigen/teichoic acid export membrane protein